MPIAIMCSGGDCSGMNPALKSFVEYSLNYEIKPYFIYDGLEGLIDGNIKEATHSDVAGINHIGGTIIRTSRSKRFFEKSYRAKAYENLKANGISKIIVLGGEGSFKALDIFSNEFEISFIGIPSTIDNDIYGTDYCLGVDTSLNVIKHALDDIHDTSASFKRAFVVETMGRNCGYLALVSSLTSGAEVCVIPELENDLDSIEKRLKTEIKNGRSYILAIVAEGSNKTKEIATFFEKRINIETRIIVLGHLQRGGNPTVYDRLIANEFVTFAMDKLIEKIKINSVIVHKNSEFQFLDIHSVKTGIHKIKPRLLELVEKLTK